MQKQTEEDFKKYLREQIGFLERSASAYDNGHESEAKRMALTTRLLVYDHGRNISLLKHLNKKDILFYDTAKELDPRNILPEFSLVYMNMVFGEEELCNYAPCLDNSLVEPRKVPFDVWWERPVIKDMEGTTFSRKDIILSLCHKDGGAHVDADLPDDYADLTRNNSFKVTYQLQNSGGPIEGIELACTRQIAHEVLKSLQDEFPDYF